MTDVRSTDPQLQADALIREARQARERSDAAALTAAAEALLAINPREPRALVFKGDALSALGDHRSAMSFYGAALAQGRAIATPPSDLRAELQHAAAAQAEGARRFEQGLREGLSQRGFDPATSSARFAASLDLMTGRRRLYYQQPKFYMFPGLPQIEFQPRETVAWLAEVEAAAPAIRAELDAILAEPALFSPYIEDRANRPRHDQAGCWAMTPGARSSCGRTGPRFPKSPNAVRRRCRRWRRRPCVASPAARPRFCSPGFRRGRRFRRTTA
jgi:tetratricopeptide (TPR) repeat protein